MLRRRPFDPLQAVAVAQHYNVIVWHPGDIAKISANDLQQLVGPGRDEWSGFTLRVGNRHLAVLNSAHSEARQNSVLMHEMAHIILGHELATAIFTEAGELVPSTYSQDQEDEAAWLGGTLLLPRPALLWMRRQGLPDEDSAERFGVSLEMLRWRVRMTGIDYQLGIASKFLMPE